MSTGEDLESRRWLPKEVVVTTKSSCPKTYSGKVWVIMTSARQKKSSRKLLINNKLRKRYCNERSNFNYKLRQTPWTEAFHQIRENQRRQGYQIIYSRFRRLCWLRPHQRAEVSHHTQRRLLPLIQREERQVEWTPTGVRPDYLRIKNKLDKNTGVLAQGKVLTNSEWLS